MKKAIVILDREETRQSATKQVLDRQVLDFVANELFEAGAEMVYVNSDTEVSSKDTIYMPSLYTIIAKMQADDEIIIVDDIYPYIKADEYAELYKHDKARIKDTKIIKVNIPDLIKGDKLSFDEIEVSDLRKIISPFDYTEYLAYIYKEIRDYHLGNGVILLDPSTTYIGPDVKIASGVTIEGNVSIYGDSFIASGTKITSGSYLENAKIGEDNLIMSSRITDSIVHDHNKIGPYAHFRDQTEVMDHCRIGNFVEFKKTYFDDYSRCAHLTYLGDATIGKDVNIGCGVVTVNYDGAHKYKTTVKDHAFIGSNANLVAPITVGEYALVAAGSTITDDVHDKDMAIARPFATTKEGYGYVYINKER